MAKNKTIDSDESVLNFINEFTDSDQKRTDSLELLRLMHEVSGHEARMWGPSIIGFGKYYYKYQSGHEGDAPLLGFSPRKAAISLYVYTGAKEHEYLLEGLGKYKIGKVCIYVKKLSDINIDNLKALMVASIDYMKANYTVAQ